MSIMCALTVQIQTILELASTQSYSPSARSLCTLGHLGPPIKKYLIRPWM